MFSIKARKLRGKARISVRAGRVLSREEFFSRPYFAVLPKNFHSSGRSGCEHIAMGPLMEKPSLIEDDGNTIWVGTLPKKVGSKGSAIIHPESDRRTMELVSLWVPNRMRMSGNATAIVKKVIGIARERGLRTLTATTSSGRDLLPIRNLLEKNGFAAVRRYPMINSVDYELKL